MGADKDYLSLPLSEFLADIAAKSPTPGGGSVAAITAAFGAALGRMVIEYTLGKPKYAAHEAELTQVRDELRKAGEAFTRLAAEDMQAYQAVVAARKQDPAALAQANARAISVPLEIVERSTDVTGRVAEIKAWVNPYLLGDLRGAAIHAEAAARAAACTVRDNLGQVAKAEAARINAQVETCLQNATAACAAVVTFNPEA